MTEPTPDQSPFLFLFASGRIVSRVVTPCPQQLIHHENSPFNITRDSRVESNAALENLFNSTQRRAETRAWLDHGDQLVSEPDSFLLLL